MIPQYSFSLCSGDLDLDGDNDIVVGHYHEQGILSYLINNGNGVFNLEDTLHFFGGGSVYEIVNLDENLIPDLITHYQNDYGGMQHFAVFYNNDIYNPIVYDTGMSGMSIKFEDSGDLDNDGDLDLVFGFSTNLWCVFYNLGNQEFSEPEFYEHHVHVIKCEDLDEDDKADVVTQGTETNIHYSTGTGFETELLCLDVVNGTMVIEDMDNDGDFDIVLSQLGQPRNYFRLYENLGNREYLLYDQNIMGSYAEALSADINGDQLIDIIFVISPPSFSVYPNLGNFVLGTNEFVFTGNLGEYTQKGSLNDFDGNETQDIAIARYIVGELNILSILFNDGEGVFYEEPVNITENEISLCNSYQLSCFPTPFQYNTNISFELPCETSCNISVYNSKGQKVKSLFNGTKDKGIYSIFWDGKDESNIPVSSGVYFYKLAVNGKNKSIKKCLLVK